MSRTYLTFDEQPPEPGRRTVRVLVRSKRHRDVLGEIKWFGRWRQYAFFPEPGTGWNPECLGEVTARIVALMAARRNR